MRILIIDKQIQACQGLKALLDAWYQISALREAANICEALHMIEEFLLNLILVDIRMPDRDGLEAIQLFKAKYQSITVIVFSMDSRLKVEALAAGAKAFICKSDPPEKLREALVIALQDNVVKPRPLLKVRNGEKSYAPTYE